LGYNPEQLFERIIRMGLNLESVLKQVHHLSQTIADNEARVLSTVPEALAALEGASSVDLQLINERIAAAGSRWTGAVPTDEPVNLASPPLAHPETLNLIAADGSQIYPDRHRAVNYTLINIGSILYRHGSRDAPATRQIPHFLIESDEPGNGEAGDMSALWVNGQRDVAEMAELGARAEECSGQPSLALLDNSLLLWIALRFQANRSPVIERLLDEYLAALDRLRASGCALAGVIDRPRSQNVVVLLDLIDELLGSEALAGTRPMTMSGITDEDVFRAFLPPGHRSAQFVLASPLNERFKQAGHEVHAFYLNPGQSGVILRVEIPSWVAGNRGLVDVVHAGIIEQCRATHGFPYVLARAHELAVITQQDQQAIQGLLIQLLSRHGIHAQPSGKSRAKGWTGAKRRHRI
jgi:hypothetical protein